MSNYEPRKLQELIHPLDDVMGFHLDIIENYARKLKPADKFEIMNACKGLKQQRLHMLQTVEEILESSTRIDVEQENKNNQDKQLALLQGKDEAFSLLAEIIKQQRQGIEDQIKLEGGIPEKVTRRKKR